MALDVLTEAGAVVTVNNDVTNVDAVRREHIPLSLIAEYDCTFRDGKFDVLVRGFMAASGPSWFETREAALLTMRSTRHRHLRCSHSH